MEFWKVHRSKPICGLTPQGSVDPTENPFSWLLVTVFQEREIFVDPIFIVLSAPTKRYGVSPCLSERMREAHFFFLNHWPQFQRYPAVYHWSPHGEIFKERLAKKLDSDIFALWFCCRTEMNLRVQFCMTSDVFSYAFSFFDFSEFFHGHYLICHPSIGILSSRQRGCSLRPLKQGWIEDPRSLLKLPKITEVWVVEPQLGPSLLTLRPIRPQNSFPPFNPQIFFQSLLNDGHCSRALSFPLPVVMDI